MELSEFCARVGLAPEAVAAVREFSMPDGEYAAYAALFARDHTEFSARVRERPGAALTFLYLFVRLALDCHAEYRRRDIPDAVYCETFRDIAIWEREHRRVTGQTGVSEDCWLWLHPQLRLFRLGRLQFQPYAMPKDLRLPQRRLWQFDPVLNVHIPKDGPLDPAAFRDSYRRARGFFRGYPPIFYCESWLLCPELPRLLRAGSNILEFQKEYQLYETEPGSRQAEHLIFGRVLDDPAEYPEDTSLQRAAKRFLEMGGKLESGVGVRLGCE